MRSLAEACVSERCYRRQDDSQLRFDKSVPSKVFFIISMFNNGSFTPEFTRGLHTFDLMQKCCFCIWWLMLTCCYDVNVALQVANKDKNINANNLTLFKLSSSLETVGGFFSTPPVGRPKQNTWKLSVRCPVGNKINRLLSSWHCTF